MALQEVTLVWRPFEALVQNFQLIGFCAGEIIAHAYQQRDRPPTNGTAVTIWPLSWNEDSTPAFILLYASVWDTNWLTG